MPLVRMPPGDDTLFRRLRRALKMPRRLRVTREGKYFIAITFGLGLAAINTGNNLLYLGFGLLISLLAISGVLSEVSLRHITAMRRLPARSQVGRAHLVEIEVFNHKRRAPSYAIEVEDLRDGRPADKRCFFLKISPRSAQLAAYRRVPTHRGIETQLGLRIATRYPFGLFEKSREVQAPGSVLVYPAIDPVRLKLPQIDADVGEMHARSPGRGDDIVTVRPMREGDDPRDIYWRKSTQKDHLVILERSRPAREETRLRLDATHPGDAPSRSWSTAFEKRVRDVASRAVAHVRRGDPVTLVATNGQNVRATPESGPEALLRVLALIQGVPRDEKQRPAKTAGRRAAGGDA